MKNHPFLIFVHVEKAGGISVNNMLHHHLAGYVSPSPQYGEQFGELTLRKVQRFYPLEITGVGGHRISPTAVFSEHQLRFSFVREPQKRFLSHLNWQTERMGIEHSLESFAANPYFQNFQTFRLTRSRDFSEARAIIQKHYDLVGLLEEFDTSVDVLSCLYYGESGRLSYEKMNTTQASHTRFRWNELDKKQQGLIQRANQVDLDIYRWIREEVFPELKSRCLLSETNIATLKSPTRSTLKRKMSNAYVGRILQPLLQEKVEYGY